MSNLVGVTSPLMRVTSSPSINKHPNEVQRNKRGEKTSPPMGVTRIPPIDPVPIEVKKKKKKVKKKSLVGVTSPL